MKYLIHAEEIAEYEADAESLKEEFPLEYKAFLAEGESSDAAWVEDCWDNGGPGLFKLLSIAHDVSVSRRAGKGSE